MRLDHSIKILRVWLVILIGVALFTSYRSASSLNPLEVYRIGGTGAKVFLSILGVMIGLGVWKLLMTHFMLFIISFKAKQPAADVICPGCMVGLLANMSRYGNIAPCPRPKCRNIWHAQCVSNRGGHKLMGCPECQESDRAGDGLESFETGPRYSPRTY